MHVNNVAPSIAISGAASVNEGSAYSLTLGAVTDPGTDTVSSYVVHWGDGNSSDTYAANGAKSHTYTDGPNDYNVTVDLVDEDGTFLDAANALSVHVNNVAPSIAISGNANVDEGSAYSLTLGAITDPGTDTVTSWIVHWGDGNSDTYGSGGAKSHTYADGPNDYNVTVDLVDEDGTFLDRANALSVHVNNVAPTVTFTTAPATANEGDTKTYTYSVTDPGSLDTFTVDATYPKCGLHGTISGTPTVTASGGSFDCSFPDGPNSSTVAIKVTDNNGGSDTASEAVQIVAVANVAPSVTAAADQSSNEGASHSFNLGSFSDPGDDSPWNVTVDWGDGSFPLTSFTATSTGTIAATSHTYADGPNDYTVTVSVNDGNDTTSKTFEVHVNNVAPSIAISGNANVNEGSAYSLTLGAVTDPGTDTVSSYVVHWGDGNSNTYTTNGAKSHTYADGPNDYNVTVDLVDEDGTFTNAANALSVHVNNVAPSIAISGAANVDEGSAYSLTLGAVTDPGTDTVSSYVVHWGDGSSDTYLTNGAKSHTYTDGPNDYNVTVDLVDEDGTFLDAANALSVHVNNVAPSTPSLSSPADNATTNDNTPAFDWSDSTDPAGANDTITYRIQVDDNCDFSSPERDQTTSSSDFTPLVGLADGTYCWRVNASDEDGGTSAYSVVRHITIDTAFPTVSSINRANTNPTNAASVSWTVKFSKSVSGVDSGDFALANTGLGGSPAITGVTGTGDTYTVTASTGTGNGTLGLNLVDNDSISDGAGNPLGGTGAGNGSFTGQVYTIDRSAPSVTINQAATQTDPTNTAPIQVHRRLQRARSTGFGNNSPSTTGSTAGGTLVTNVYPVGAERRHYLGRAGERNDHHW